VSSVCGIIWSNYTPLKGYWDFQADRTKAHELRIKIEAFELEANQRKPIDTDSSLHEKRQVEHKLWTETEFRKRFTEDVRKIYPKMFPHPNSLLQTEMAADDLTIQSARLWSARLILVAQLRGEALATFSLDSWFKDNWKVRIIRQCLIVTLLVWGALFWVSSK
jgi:hypothetical protein